MSRLLRNAAQHLDKLGEIRVTIYPQGIRAQRYTVKAKTIETAKIIISNCNNSLTDECNIPHINLISK